MKTTPPELSVTKLTTTIDPKRILFGSDFHFGYPSIPQDEMAFAFQQTIYPILTNLDLFFINGDFFETLVIFDNHGFDPIYETMMGILYRCQENDVALRVMRGTFTHDRDQCRRFETFYKNNNFTFDFKYIDTIALEEISLKDRNIRVFYVPDNLKYTHSQDVVDVIISKMNELGWDSVDYGCMHGFFDFTFPQNISSGSTLIFKESQFPFVKKMIDVGHVHQNQTCGKVISNGSFDRMCHGDESPKGCILVNDYPNHYTATFVENTHAMRFDTLQFEGDVDTQYIRKVVEDRLKSITTPRRIALRFDVPSNEHYETIKSWMKEQYPEIKISRKRVGENKTALLSTGSSDLITRIEKRIAPTPETLAVFVKENIGEDVDLSIDKIDTYLKTKWV